MATRAVRKPSPARSSPGRAQLRVVQGERKPPRKGKTRSRSPLPVVVLVVITVFGVAAIQAWVSQDGLHAARLEREVQQEQERLTLLRAQVAQLGSPQRLREEARKLGLVPAPDMRYLRVEVPADAQAPPANSTHRIAAAGP